MVSTLDTIRLNAMAKINLGLDVIGKRPDGYHDVRMIMQSIRLYDRIDIESTPQPGISLRTNLPFLPTDERNIAYKAARRMLEDFHIDGGVKISIEKHIPVAAGMAGGSTDCAAVLYGMDHLFSLGLGQEKLMKIGLSLGADVPYCLLRQAALAEGIGEVLTPLPPIAPCHILIAKPPVSVSTGQVYQSLILDRDTPHPDIDGMARAMKTGSLPGVVSRLGNVLESVTISMHPVIADIKKNIMSAGALGALMSGSGPTVFGIFDDEGKARAAYDIIRDSGLVQQVFLTSPVDFEKQAE